jgi:hypothetical protein
MPTKFHNGNIVADSAFSARSAVKSLIATSSEDLKKTEDYQTVTRLISRLIESGVVFMGQGYCISMSDILYTLLMQHDIKCRMVECQLAITHKKDDAIWLIGFDNQKSGELKNEVDTHVVIVTDTEIPMLIDLSISHKLPEDMNAIIDAVELKDNRVIATINHPGVSLIYQERERFKLPLLHQTSIVDRIKTDKKIFKDIKFLMFLVVFSVSVSSINLIRGTYDFYKVHVAQQGASADEIKKRINRLEKMMRVPLEDRDDLFPIQK